MKDCLEALLDDERFLKWLANAVVYKWYSLKRLSTYSVMKKEPYFCIKVLIQLSPVRTVTSF